ncbi:STAS domain-containing protein [Deltaproteobacteria bacterium TL4]
MDITHHFEGQFCLIRVKNNTFVEQPIELKKYLNRLLEAHELGGVIINLEETTMVDSHVLGVLIACFKRLAQFNIPMGLCNIDKKLGWVFQNSGMDQIIPIYPSLQEALHHLKPAS